MGNPNTSEKTEKATPRRRSKERKKGNIAKSQDLNSAVAITAGMAILAAMSSRFLSKIQEMLYNTFTHLNPKDIKVDDILLVIMPFVQVLIQTVLPFLIVISIIIILAIRMQIGHVFAPEKVKLKLDSLSPSRVLQNAQKLINPFNPRNMVEFVKSILKLVIVFICGYSAVIGRQDEIYGLLGLNVHNSFAVIGSILTHMIINICLAMLVIGFVDKKYQDYEYEKSIKMTKQEIKDEMKQMEGDPKIKAKIRRIQMKMANQRMMSNVATADVVVTNPTHFAVALEYNRLKSPAPRVVAKGVDFVAFKIKEIAMNNNVPVVENPPLARALYKLVPIDGIIPSDMFVAVAEVLAYVYNKDNKGVG